MYYFQGVPSWEWFYPYDFPPFLSDIQSYIVRNSFRISNITFYLSKPLSPYEQLMAILPSDRCTLLPNQIRPLMLNPLSALGSLIPKTYSQDIFHRNKFYQAIPLLPQMNLNVVKEAFHSIEDTLSEMEQINNTSIEKFVFDGFF